MKYYNLLFFLCFSICSFGQVTISNAEYFWDTDPGEGNGISFSATDGSFDTALENILEMNIGVPSIGLHTFNVRLQNSNTSWGPVFTQVINVSADDVGQSVTLANAEYFWDADPGEGNGIAFSATDGNFDNALETILETNIGVPSTGLHTFNVRLQNSNNSWGSVFTQVVDVSANIVGQSVTLIDAEFFWDTDPGEGNAVAFAAADGNFDNALENLLETSLDIVNPVGLHTFNVRVKNSKNNWGPVFTQVINVETFLSITDNNFGINFNLIPNPSRLYTNIHLGNPYDTVQLHVTDMLGKSVFKSSYNNTSNIKLNTYNYAKGMYLVTVVSKQKKATLKLIVK